jgi:hypothetical protein
MRSEDKSTCTERGHSPRDFLHAGHKERPAIVSVLNGTILFCDEMGMEPLEDKQWKADAELAKVYPVIAW